MLSKKKKQPQAGRMRCASVAHVRGCKKVQQTPDVDTVPLQLQATLAFATCGS